MSERSRHRRRNRQLVLLTVLSVLATLLSAVPPQVAQASVTVTAFAGTGVDGYNGTDIAATSAKLWGPMQVAADASGQVYIADRYNQIIRKVDTGGTIRQVAGSPGVARLVANGGLFQPGGIAVTQSGGYFIADTLNNVIWNSSGGIAVGASAGLSQPAQLTYDDTTNTLYIVDQYNCRVRALFQGNLTTVAGNGSCGFGSGGDGGAGTSATLDSPNGVAYWNHLVFIADTSNYRVRVVDTSTGTIQNYAGIGQNYDGADGGTATSTAITAPYGLTVDPAGNLYIGENSGNIRVVSRSGTISTVAAVYGSVRGLTRDRLGNLYASTTTQSVYKVSGYPAPVGSYVALGDSVAAGEGINYSWTWDNVNHIWIRNTVTTPIWEPATVTGALAQDCHRSMYGYPQALASKIKYSLVHLACTGATSGGGILASESFGSDGASPAQLGTTGSGTNPPNTTYDAAAPDIVTLTVGADDINFGGWLKTCYFPTVGDECDSTTNDTTVATQIADAKANLDTVLNEIYGRGVTAGKVPHVYLTGYYDPFPSSYPGSPCEDLLPIYGISWGNHAGLSSNEMVWLKNKLVDLNSAISSEVTTFNSNVGSSVTTYVDATNLASGHELCTSDPWVYGPSIQAPTGFGGSGDSDNPAPFHPLPALQAKIADAIASSM